ncbi:MAG: hypothetical protein V4635_03095 [Bacteroidota bacterium]
MNKPWLGYLSSVLLLFAGIFMIAGNKTVIGCFFIALSITGLFVKMYMNKKSREDQNK